MNEKLLLQDLVVLLAKKAEITQKDADKFYRELVQLILETIYENDIVKIKDFGTFKLVSISTRESVDVNTGEKIEIPAHFRLAFTPDRTLKELVNKPFEQFESVVLEDGVDLTQDIKYKDNREDKIISNNDIEKDKETPINTSEVRVPSREDIQKIEDTNIDISENDLIPLESVKRMKTNRYISPIEPISDNNSAKATVKKNEEPKRYNNGQLLEVEDKPEKPVINPIIREDRPPISEIRISERKRERITLEPEIKKTDQRITNSIDTDTKDEKNEVDEQFYHAQKEDYLFVNKEREGLHLENQGVNEDSEIQEKATLKVNAKLPVDSANDQGEIVKNESDSANSDYGYVDYEKINEQSKKRKRIPIIILAVLVGVFAVYQFAKLFDVTHDYEYYINRPHHLTLTDTLPYLDEPNTIESKSDTSVGGIVEDVDNVSVMSNNNVLDKEKNQNENQLPQISGINSKIDSADKSSPNLESLVAKLDSQSINISGVYQVSENFQIRVMNKAGAYLRKNRTNKVE